MQRNTQSKSKNQECVQRTQGDISSNGVKIQYSHLVLFVSDLHIVYLQATCLRMYIHVQITAKKIKMPQKLAKHLELSVHTT